ncbi:MAG: hyuA [Enterovirga sp.]|nr:hyuA [Enterovirga sp.]
MTWSIGIDTGGTFTDVAGLDLATGRLHTVKVPSTPHDPSEAVLAGIDAFVASVPGMRSADIGFFAHGTTVATNAVIERKGARSGLLITRGTGAVYMARSSAQPMPGEMIDPGYRKPSPLIPGRMTREITERTLFDGTIETPLDEASVLAAVRELVAAGDVESIAICFLFSFMNPTSELAARDIIHRHHPDIRVSLSCELLPVIREYRRLSTTVADAFVGPVLQTYLGRLGDGLRARDVADGQSFIMQSNGGLMTVEVARANPVQTLLSGPAACVISGAYLSGITGIPNIVTFDVGGTSTDVALIVGGQITETQAGTIAGHHAYVPMNEISTIGAGGGTIARVGQDGRLKVGPDSAGASPGPACYGRGGSEPTVTDADLVLGYLHPNTFLGGTFPIQEEAARNAIADAVARPLGLDLDAAAMGIIKLTTSLMEGELRLRLLARGYDPRGFALVAVGGAGPLHASLIARNLGIQQVIVPPYPGLGSAMGLLLTDVKRSYVQSRLRHFDEAVLPEMETLFAALIARASDEVERGGKDLGEVQLERVVDLRYVGQGYELSIPLAPGPLTPASIEAARARFHELHLDFYGNAAPEKPLEMINLRIKTTTPLRKLSLPRLDCVEEGTVAQPDGWRAVYFEEGGRVQTGIFQRNKLRPGHVVNGPAIIDQMDSTTVLLPAQRARIDAYGNILIATGEGAL